MPSEEAATETTVDDAEPGKDWLPLFRRSLRFVMPDRSKVAVILGLTLLVAVGNAVEPLVLKFIFDAISAGPGGNVDLLLQGVLGLLALVLGREAVQAGGNWLKWRVRLKVHYRLLEEVVDRLHSLPVDYHRERSVGGIMRRLDQAIQGYLGALTTFSFETLPTITYLIIAVYFMFTLSVPLTLLVLFFAPLPMVIGWWAAREQTEREQKLLDKWTEIYSRWNEVLAGIVTVKSFAKEEVEKDRFLGRVQGANDVVAHGVGYDSTMGALQNGVAAVARIATIGLGGYLILQGRVTLGTLMAFLGYIGGLFGPVQGLTGTYQGLRRASVGLVHIFSILDADDMLDDADDAIELPTLRGDVEFDEVSLQGRDGTWILKEVDIDVDAGESIAIVGPSGAGKSTLMSVLMRLYDPTEGAVRVDGVDLKRVKQRPYRRQIGIVLQEPVLFDTTVRDAIAYGRPDADLEDVEAAARAANAHDFIMEKPEGYDTQVGERGQRLSGGERQRIAIARALLKDPRMVILDEPTAALDAESEVRVQQALENLTEDRTTFIIAHRLSTVRNADRIIVMKNGRVTETGTHRELMEGGGYYSLLVRHQVGGLLPDTYEVPKEEVVAQIGQGGDGGGTGEGETGA